MRLDKMPLDKLAPGLRFCYFGNWATVSDVAESSFAVVWDHGEQSVYAIKGITEAYLGFSRVLVDADENPIYIPELFIGVF
jgi:hypothetical protein